MAKAPKEKTKVIVKTSTRMSKKGPLTPDMLRKLDAYWRAANYLAAGQLYLPQAHLGGPLGYGAGPKLYLHPPEPGNHTP